MKVAVMKKGLRFGYSSGVYATGSCFGRLVLSVVMFSLNEIYCPQNVIEPRLLWKRYYKSVEDMKGDLNRDYTMFMD